jgi:hypothetical protein
VNHRPLTVAKNKISSLLKRDKFREFRIDMNQIEEVNANGKTLEIVAR